MGVALRKAGLRDFTIVSRAGGVGGVWWDNRYPGAACDVPSSLYSFSFEPNFDWSRSHGTHEEIRRYLEHCVRKYRLGPHLRFDTEIVSATFDDETAVWRLRTTTGEELTANVLVSACGLFNRPVIPDFPGRADFAGPSFHTTHWQQDFDPTGKRIAVIGTGCSAAQIVPAIVDRAAQLVVFQRTPPYVNPASASFYDAGQRRRYRLLPYLRGRERKKLFDTMETGYASRIDPSIRRKREEDFRRFLESQVSDPEKRRKLTPQYEFGCKRNVNSDTFLAALDRPNVDVVTTTIERIAADGVVTDDGAHHPVDAIVYATGFTPARYLSTMEISGAGGQRLADAWADGPEAYLGMTVAGFPNFFMIYGPNTNAPTSIVFMIECQIAYIVQCIRGLARRRLHWLQPLVAVQRRFNDEVQRALRGTVWTSGCRSYGQTASGKVVTQWPNRGSVYRQLTRRVNWSDFATAPDRS
jgi:cation diffusion facilitator CzcD-associated flavoprotein CzcO